MFKSCEIARIAIKTEGPDASSPEIAFLYREHKTMADLERVMHEASAEQADVKAGIRAPLPRYPSILGAPLPNQIGKSVFGKYDL